MRWLISALIGAALFALPASAAGVDPKLLVLGHTDVPFRYVRDDQSSGTISVKLRWNSAETRRIVTRSGFLTGYGARYIKADPPDFTWRYVTSYAYVFRRAEGAQIYLAWLDKKSREQGAVRRVPVGLGDTGASYSSRSLGTHVLWRSGRVVAHLSCEEMTGHRTLALALAKKQQRRIATALR